MTFTKEQLIERCKSQADYAQAIIDLYPDDVGAAESRRIAEIALAALSGMEAEPVAARYRHHNGRAPSIWKYVDSAEECNSAPNYQCQALYAAPQPLTTSERAELENYRNAQQVVPGGLADFEVWFNSPESGLRVVNFNIQHELQLKAWNACQAAMQSGAVKDGWVACSERMPDKLIPVMIMYADGEMWSALWTGRKWDDGTEFPDPHPVTHWQEMPAAPQQEAVSSALEHGMARYYGAMQKLADGGD